MPYQTVGDLDLFYEDIGMGDPVLLIHGSYSRGIIAFSGQIQPFFHRYRLLLPDLRGHGRTRSSSPDWSTLRMAEDLTAFLELMETGPVHLLGYSMGGGVALHLAARRPDLARSLVTIGTPGVADPTGSEEYEPEALQARGEWEFIRRMEILHAEAHGGDWEGYLRRTVADWRRYPSLSGEDWSRLTMPMLLVGGEEDGFTPPEALEGMQSRCPQAELYRVPGAGHRPHMPTEQCKEVNARLADFWSRVPSLP